MSRQSITDLFAHAKTVTSQGPVFAESLELGTENPRVENTAIRPVSMHPEGSDLFGGFLCLTVCVEGDIPVFFDMRGFIEVGFGYEPIFHSVKK